MPDIVVTGSIKDENGEALVGVTVQIKGTTKGTTTGQMVRSDYQFLMNKLPWCSRR
jgi:hypothetical protein